ncbi:MAG: hypothetical protein WBR18_02390, partial [Anaerolineales bacterium]
RAVRCLADHARRRCGPPNSNVCLRTLSDGNHNTHDSDSDGDLDDRHSRHPDADHHAADPKRNGHGGAADGHVEHGDSDGYGNGDGTGDGDSHAFSRRYSRGFADAHFLADRFSDSNVNLALTGSYSHYANGRASYSAVG